MPPTVATTLEAVPKIPGAAAMRGTSMRNSTAALPHRPETTPVRSVMTWEVLSAEPGWTLARAARAMRRHRISGLPVLDRRHRVVGIVSEKDILRDLDRVAGVARVRGTLDLLLELDGGLESSRLEPCLRRLRRGRVREVMSTPAVTIDGDATVGDAARRLWRFSVKRLPVLTGDRLVGIVTRANLLEAFESPKATGSARGPWSRHRLHGFGLPASAREAEGLSPLSSSR